MNYKFKSRNLLLERKLQQPNNHSMTTNQLKELINASGLSEDTTKQLIAMLGNDETVSTEVLGSVTETLREHAASLKQEVDAASADVDAAMSDLKQDPEAVGLLADLDGELAKVDQQATQRIDSAYQEFSNTMDEIDQEATDTYNALGKALDEEEVESVRGSIQA